MRKGFTLIELLVVIAIIAILAAILFPVFARAREKARQSSCLSNLKQIATATLMYVQDYDERFPMHWSDGTVRLSPQARVMPYVRNDQIWVCPSGYQEYYYYWDTGYPGAPDPIDGSYGYNAELNNDLLADVSAPAETGMWADAQKRLTRLYDNGVYRTEGRHNEGGNMAYVDGHAKWQQCDYLFCGFRRADHGRPDWELP